MDLILVIVIVVTAVKFIKKNMAEEKRIQSSAAQNPWDDMLSKTAAMQKERMNPNTYDRQTVSDGQNDDWKQIARENIAKAKKRAEKKMLELENLLEIEEETPAAKKQIPESRIRETTIAEKRKNAQKPTILERAIANTEADKEDKTLESLEAEHHHSERVAPASHKHPEDVIPENMLGTIEDLMIKGYDGNLCFERDFVGEAMDMINRFTISTDIPNPATSEK